MENSESKPATLFTGGPSLYAVSLQKAKDSVKLFQQTQLGMTKAFTVHAGDFLGALGYSQDQITEICKAYPLPYDHARMYLGIDTESNNTNLKVFILPVRNADIGPRVLEAGRDVVPYGDFKEYEESEMQHGQFVYDLIAPCPGTCDTSSPLYFDAKR